MSTELMNPYLFLDRDTAFRIRETVGTPCYVYDEATLRENARKVLAFPNAFGLTARFAMKASPNANILRLFASMGLDFDASSGYEVTRAMKAGIAAQRISLSTQELPKNLKELVDLGLSVNACSLNQLETYGQLFPGSKVGLRFNPGLGSGGTQRTNVGGPASSFGIWKDFVGEAKAIAAKHDLTVFRIHTHIGSGSDPDVWVRAVSLSLDIARQFETVTALNLGGGYKVARVEGEKSTDLQKIGAPMKELFQTFAQETGRKLHLEVEPGTFLVASAGAVVSTVQDVVTTGESGYTFAKLDTGMTEILRPAMYGSQHTFAVFAKDGQERPAAPVLIVGHCCESGDILTPVPGDPEALKPRELPLPAVGDVLVIGGAGAYCAGMPAKNYNSFPEAPEAMLRESGAIEIMRKTQTLEQILANEQELAF